VVADPAVGQKLVAHPCPLCHSLCTSFGFVQVLSQTGLAAPVEDRCLVDGGQELQQTRDLHITALSYYLLCLHVGTWGGHSLQKAIRPRPKDILLACENLILIIKSERSGMVACSCDPGYL
jgi:hypothetical protein